MPKRTYTFDFRFSFDVEAASEDEACDLADAKLSELTLTDVNYDMEEGDCVMCGGEGEVAVGPEDVQPCLCKAEREEE